MDCNSDTEDRHSVGRNFLAMTIENHENQARKWWVTLKNRKVFIGVAGSVVGLVLIFAIVVPTSIAKNKSELNSMKSEIMEFKKITQKANLSENSLKSEITELKKIIQKANLIPRTCHDYQRSEGRGKYAIEPKKRYNTDLTFTARCDFTTGSTYIDHDHPEFVGITPCAHEKCFILPIKYDTSLENIKNLMAASEECFQDVEFECVHSKLTGFAGWTDSSDMYHEYFTSNDTNKCLSVSTERNIHGHDVTKPEEFCKCDYFKDETVYIDRVTINSKALLPLEKFYYGRMGSPPHRGAVKIGPLTCKGTNQTFPKTCEDHFNAGNPPGYYNVMIDHRMTVAYCKTDTLYSRSVQEEKSHLFGRDYCSNMNYKTLNHESRKFGHHRHTDYEHGLDYCDKEEQDGNDWGGQAGWYRVVPPAGWKLFEKESDDDWIINSNKQCSSTVPGYLSAEHPTYPGQILNGTVCFNYGLRSCIDKIGVQIKHCGAYYLYYLKPVPNCSYRYCTE